MERLRRGWGCVQGWCDRLARRVPAPVLVVWRALPWWLTSYLLLIVAMGTIMVLALGAQGLTYLAGPHPPTVLAWALMGLHGLVDGVALVVALTALAVVLWGLVQRLCDEFRRNDGRRGGERRSLPASAPVSRQASWYRTDRSERSPRRRRP